MTTCPKCGKETLTQSMRSDFCINPDCDYTERYEDAYLAVDPGGDFEDSEVLK